MRVIRRKGQFGTQIEVAGSGRAMDPAMLARILGRRVGAGGGLRDPLPGNPRERFSRDRYIGSIAFPREVAEWIKKQARKRGLSRTALVGMIVECVRNSMSDEQVDDLLACDGEQPT